MTIRELKTACIKELKDFSPSPELDVSCFFQERLNRDRTWLLMHSNDSLPDSDCKWICHAVNTRKTGLPVAYITGKKEFYGYTFSVNPAVLIPKPDTEILVENAVNAVIKASQTWGKKRVLNICDMCTGSGCIGISVYLSLLEKNFPREFFPNFTFADLSPDALQVAKLNAKKLIPNPVSNLRFIRSNLFENVPQRFDFVLTNPPYIPSSMVDELLTDGRNEPRIALDGDINPETGTMLKDNDGLGIIRKELPQIKNVLDPDGMFFMESGEYNAGETAAMAKALGFKNVEIIKDLEGQLRVTKGSV